MKIYEVENISGASLFIEDLNIRLNGKGSKVRISQYQLAYSKSLKELTGLVKITDVLLANKPSEIPRKLDQQRIDSSPNLNSSLNTDNQDKPNEKMNELMSKVSQLIDVVNTYTDFMKSSSLPTPTIGLRNDSNKNGDVFFIPSKIVPDGVNSAISSKHTETDRDDLEEASKALKKLRKR